MNRWLYLIAVLGIPLAIPVIIVIKLFIRLTGITPKRREGFQDLAFFLGIAVFAGIAEIGTIVGGIIGACVGGPIFGSAMLGLVVVVIGEAIFCAIKK